MHFPPCVQYPFLWLFRIKPWIWLGLLDLLNFDFNSQDNVHWSRNKESNHFFYYFILPKTPANETPDAHLFQQWSVPLITEGNVGKTGE